MHQLLIDRKITKKQLLAALEETPVSLRPGARAMIESLLQLRAPVAVISAGLEYVITKVMTPLRICPLEDRGGNCVHLVANRIVFQEDVCSGVLPEPPVTAANKHIIYDRLHTFFDTILTDRSRVLLVGDSVGDVRAVDSIPKSYLLKIGFFNPDNPFRSPRHKFDDAFDVLLPHTASFDWLLAELAPLLPN